MDRLDAAFLARTGRGDAGRAAPPGGVSASAAEPVGPMHRLADAVLAAGCRVVAVAGAGSGAASRVLVAGIVRALAAQGRVVGHRDGPVLRAVPDEPGAAGGIVVVRCGDWFPPGAVNHRRLVSLACGCEGVILVTASPVPCPAHVAALRALGIAVVATLPAASSTGQESAA